MIKNKVNLIFLFFFLCFLFPVYCQGAVLYLEPNNGEYKAGDILVVDIRIDNAGECINAIGAELSFSNDILFVDDFIVEDSILTHWIKRPGSSDVSKINEQGKISFSGGIPGGYCGRISGDPGLTNVLAKIIFRIPGLIILGGDFGSKAEISFLPDSKVFLHDGFGTQAELYTQGAKFMISDKATSTGDEWIEKLESDDIPPEPFIVELQHLPLVFDGKYFIIFWTTDKQTGLDYFEVQEGEEDFKIVDSPYLLEDQTLRNTILVKAVDKAGNERLVEYIPSEHGYVPESMPPKVFSNLLVNIILILLIGVIIIVVIKLLIKKLKAKKQKEKTDTELEP